MKFEINKYYEHVNFSAKRLHILTEAITSTWGDALLAETVNVTPSIIAIKKDMNDCASYKEISKEKWEGNLSEQEKMFCQKEYPGHLSVNRIQWLINNDHSWGGKIKSKKG